MEICSMKLLWLFSNMLRTHKLVKVSISASLEHGFCPTKIYLYEINMLDLCVVCLFV